VIAWAAEAMVAMLQVMRSIRAGMYIVMLIDVRRVFRARENRWHIDRSLETVFKKDVA
jgi:hypothetical protein